MEVKPSLNVEMHFDEFKQSVDEIIRKYDKLLSNNPSDARAYATLAELRKTRNEIALGGSFKKGLNATMSDQDREYYDLKLNGIINKAKADFPDIERTPENIEFQLEEKSKSIVELIKACKSEIKGASIDAEHIISTAIYRSPEELNGGKLIPSKDVLNLVGEIGNYTFAQSGMLVDNAYLLRKSGKGVCRDKDICIPGDPNLVYSEDGHAMLKDPLYVYLMSTEKFEPVISISLKGDTPAIDFAGEWATESEIDLADLSIIECKDVTEMLDYLQIFSIPDKSIYQQLAQLPYDEKIKQIRTLLEKGQIHYINDECNRNRKFDFPNNKQVPLSKKREAQIRLDNDLGEISQEEVPENDTP